MPDVEAIVGKPYSYDAEAADLDGDELAFSLLAGPDGAGVDPVTGEISWNPTTDDIGTHTVDIRVEDGRGGTDTQHYVLSTVDSLPNRPPVFTSMPVVDAGVGQRFTYDANAIDPDHDPLTYSVALGADYQETVLADEPIGYWRLGESEGPTATDASGNGNDGTYSGGVAFGASGALKDDDDSAVGLSYASHAPITVSDASSFHSEFVSVEAWVNPSGSEGTQAIIMKSSALLTGAYGLIHVMNRSGWPGITFYINDYDHKITREDSV